MVRDCLNALFVNFQALGYMPHDCHLWLSRAQAYLRIGHPEIALEDINKAIAVDRTSLKARLLKARAFFNMAEPGKAKDYFLKLKKRFPGFIGMINGKL